MSKVLDCEDTPFYFPKMVNKNKCLLSGCNHLFGVVLPIIFLAKGGGGEGHVYYYKV